MARAGRSIRRAIPATRASATPLVRAPRRIAPASSRAMPARPSPSPPATLAASVPNAPETASRITAPAATSHGTMWRAPSPFSSRSTPNPAKHAVTKAGMKNAMPGARILLTSGMTVHHTR